MYKMKNSLHLLFTTMLIAASTLFTQAYGQFLAQRNYPPKNVNVSLTESNLPIVIITTDEVLDRDDRVLGHMIVINNPDGEKNYGNLDEHPDQNIECNLPIALKWRGNTSFGGEDEQSKKPISIKTLKEDEDDPKDGKKQKVSLLGMGSDNDWTLLAPWQDKSYVRDILTMVMAQGGSTFAPQMRYCELIFNNIYYGVYILSERATKGDSRLNLKDYGKVTDADGNVDTTGDFHVEIDRPETDENGNKLYYTSQHSPVWTNGREISDKVIIYQYKDPEYEDFADLGMEAKQAVDKAIADMEDSFASNDYKNLYGNFIDITSFIDYEIAQEVSNNIDAYRLSTPMWKYSKTRAQTIGNNDRWKIALWDFNIAYGHSFGNYYDPSRSDWRYTANDIMKDYNSDDDQLIPFYWYKLMNDNAFIDQFKARYAQRRQKSYTNARVQAICDSLKSVLNQGAVTRDNSAWSNNFYGWQSEISNVSSFTIRRLEWMDTNIQLLVGTTDDPTTTGPAVPLEIESGYNMDVICEDRNNINGTVTTGNYAGIDNANWVYYSSSVRSNGAVCKNDGLYSSANAEYYVNVAGNNALVMKDGLASGGTLTLKTPAKLQKLYVTGTSADGVSNVGVTVNYKGGSSTTANFYLPDWAGTDGASVVVTNLGRLNINDGSLSTRNHFTIFELAISTEATKEVESVSFSNNSNNNPAIFSVSGVYATTDLQLAGTTFWKDNSWNTICLPFDVADIEDTPLAGAIVKKLKSSDFNDGTLSLTFTEDNFTSLEAGVPYIMKWIVNEEDKDYDPTFEGVVLKEDEHPTETECVDYIGKLSEFTLEGGDNTVLYLGADNTLYYPAEGSHIVINPYHAYFKLKGITAGENGAKNIRAINIDYNDDPQGIQTIFAPTNGLIDYWYTLDGRRLDEKPTARGIYLHQGRRVMIK